MFDYDGSGGGSREFGVAGSDGEMTEEELKANWREIGVAGRYVRMLG